MAASIAWLAVTSSNGDEAVRGAAWQTFINDVLAPHVAFHVARDEPSDLDTR
jgi:hypothetical protein